MATAGIPIPTPTPKAIESERLSPGLLLLEFWGDCGIEFSVDDETGLALCGNREEVE